MFLLDKNWFFVVEWCTQVCEYQEVFWVREQPLFWLVCSFRPCPLGLWVVPVNSVGNCTFPVRLLVSHIASSPTASPWLLRCLSVSGICARGQLPLGVDAVHVPLSFVFWLALLWLFQPGWVKEEPVQLGVLQGSKFSQAAGKLILLNLWYPSGRNWGHTS